MTNYLHWETREHLKQHPENAKYRTPKEETFLDESPREICPHYIAGIDCCKKSLSVQRRNYLENKRKGIYHLLRHSQGRLILGPCNSNPYRSQCARRLNLQFGATLDLSKMFRESEFYLVNSDQPEQTKNLELSHSSS
jgi:hypothetical protein